MGAHGFERVGPWASSFSHQLPPFPPPAQPYNISKTRLPQVARNLGCSGSTGPALLTCLRAVNETALLAADHGLTEAFLEWSPVIDGVEVLDDPRVLAAAGKLAPVPVMLGFNADEGTLFNSAPTTLNASLYEAAIATDIGDVLAPSVVANYPLLQYESPWWAICAILRDSQMLCPGQQTANWVSTAPTPQNAFVYFYTQILVRRAREARATGAAGARTRVLSLPNSLV